MSTVTRKRLEWTVRFLVLVFSTLSSDCEILFLLLSLFSLLLTGIHFHSLINESKCNLIEGERKVLARLIGFFYCFLYYYWCKFWGYIFRSGLQYHSLCFRRYEEDMYWRRMEEEQHHWDDRRRMPDGGYPHGPPGPLGLLGVRPGMPPQPQGPAVSVHSVYIDSESVRLVQH